MSTNLVLKSISASVLLDLHKSSSLWSLIGGALSFLLFSLLSLTCLAQQEPAVITGKVITGQSNQPIEFATIMLVDSLSDELLAGTTSQADGSFYIETDKKGFLVRIRFIGFRERDIRSYKQSENRIDLGEIELMADTETLDDVEVIAERSYTEFKIDKRVFNVGKDLISTGAGALEVLGNVPSVNVSIEGEVSLRGMTGVQILINGKPSVLADQDGTALGSITADMIERIEVITNPSAKYDASGTSGIINIVLKKEERRGTNGSISLNTGYPHNHSIGFSFNHRAERFNFFGQLGGGYRSLPSEEESINHNFASDTLISSVGEQFRNEGFYNLILGTDYHISETSVLTFSGSLAHEFERQPSRFDYSAFHQSDIPYSSWYREEETEATNPKWQFELQFQKKLKQYKDHKLQISAISNFFGKDQSSTFENVFNDFGGTETFQQTRTNFNEARYSFNVDYERPFNDQWTLETGSQLVLAFISNDYQVSDLVNDEWQVDAAQTNVFDFDQHVLGVYGTGAYEGEKWGLKLGLRLEQTFVGTEFQSGGSSKRNYLDLFPSGHLSYKFSKAISMQLGYSRRINRPRMWSLNPFFNIRNNFDIRTGNPELLPEYTNSYELNSIYSAAKTSWNLGIYLRHTQDIIERISTLEGNVRTTKPYNIGEDLAPGVELNGKYDPTKWLALSGNFNFNYFNRTGTYLDQSVDFSSNQWTLKLTSKWDLPAEFDIELGANYQSSYATVQGTASDSYRIDLGAKKKILKRKGVISLSVRDLFATARNESERVQTNFYAYAFSKRGQFVRLGFSYGFGKGDAMEFTGRRRF